MSNWRSTVEKMKMWMVPAASEARLFCAVCKVPRPQGPSDHADVLVRRIHDSIYLSGYAIIFLKDFYILEMMYDVDWNKMHRVIFRHKKKNAYVLLYSGDLHCDAKNAMKNDFGTTISELVNINYHSFSGNTDVKILTIKGAKSNGRHLSCDFVYVNHAELILSSYKTSHVHHAESILISYETSHGTEGNTVRVEPHPDGSL